MDRLSLRWGVLFSLLIALSAPVLLSGCRSALATIIYVIKGNQIEAEYKELKEKTVAVVCRPVVELKYGNPYTARNLAEEISKLLQQRVPKIQVIDQAKVAQWCDNNPWEEYPQVGKALKAERVVGIDLEYFNIYEGQTLYQGKANATIRIYDCTDGGKVVFEKHLPQSVYPPNTCIPTSDLQEAEFRHEFLQVLADQIARHFYAHDTHADLAQDTAALR